VSATHPSCVARNRPLGPDERRHLDGLGEEDQAGPSEVAADAARPAGCPIARRLPVEVVVDPAQLVEDPRHDPPILLEPGIQRHAEEGPLRLSASARETGTWCRRRLVTAGLKPPIVRGILGSMAEGSVAETLWIGVAGWSYPDWDGIVYPRVLPRKAALRYLAGYFDCIEINSTFYRPADAGIARRWIESIADRPRFLFTAKLHGDFTHKGALDQAAIDAFRAGIDPLAEAGRLGALLAQFPWFFEDGPETRARIERIANAFGAYPLAVEVRHRSFATRDALSFIESLGLNFVAIDLPAAHDSIGPSTINTGPIGYVRFHGRNREAWFSREATRDQKYDYLYDPAELASWLPRIRRLAEKTRRTFVIANNHYRGKAPANALELIRLLIGGSVEAPAPLLDAYPRLRDEGIVPRGEEVGA